MKTLGFIFLLSSFAIMVNAQDTGNRPNQQPANAAAKAGEDVRIIKYEHATPDSSANTKSASFISGISVSADVLGMLLSAVSSYGQIEGGLRVGIKQKFYPTIELGLGMSDHTNSTTDIHYKTRAPYGRIGFDYNFARDKRSGNRIFGGVRYAFTSFKFDLRGHDITDPVWHTTTAYDFKDQKSSMHWFELVFGLEAKIWKNFHIGWTARYRKRLSQSVSEVGQAWYVPGYGKNDGHVWGGTFNLVFDI